MKFRKLIIVSFPILFFALVSQARAQACGTYHININLQNENGEPIETNAIVRLSPLEKDETRGKNFVRDNANLALFSINYPEGYSFASFHKLTISADRFKPTENKVRFTSCQDRDVVVKLAKANSDADAIWQFKNNVNVEVVGADKKNIDDVKLTIVDNKKNSEFIEMKFGSSYFYLPNGEYKFRFEKTGYQTEEIKVDLTPLSGKYIKVELKSQANRQ